MSDPRSETGEHWVRFALSTDVTATVLFTARPTADDLAALNEILDVQARVLRRSQDVQDALLAVGAGREDQG